MCSSDLTGCGLVQVYTAKANLPIMQSLLPEAIVSTYETYDEEELKRLIGWADVVAIGCGLGQSDVAQRLVEGVLQFADCPCILDADALNILAKHMDWLMYTRQDIILTPHMKEMTRLLGCTVDELQNERFRKLVNFVEANVVTCAKRCSHIGSKARSGYLYESVWQQCNGKRWKRRRSHRNYKWYCCTGKSV